MVLLFAFHCTLLFVGVLFTVVSFLMLYLLFRIWQSFDLRPDVVIVIVIVIVRSWASCSRSSDQIGPDFKGL